MVQASDIVTLGAPIQHIHIHPIHLKKKSLSCLQTTVAESATIVTSPCLVSRLDTVPGSCSMHSASHTLSSSLEPFPRLSICGLDEGAYDEDKDDDGRYWHCMGLEHILDERFPQQGANISKI